MPHWPHFPHLELLPDNSRSLLTTAFEDPFTTDAAFANADALIAQHNLLADSAAENERLRTLLAVAWLQGTMWQLQQTADTMLAEIQKISESE